jgi:hypothetical protein
LLQVHFSERPKVSEQGRPVMLELEHRAIPGKA